MPENAKELWLGIGKQALTFAVGVITAAFVLGGTRQKIHDMAVWKAEVAPRIERMDSKGTISFDIFHNEYLRTQARQEERLKELEKEVKELLKKVDP
jgi:hypothetical protein